MTSNPSPPLRQELLDEFYAECEELLVSARAGLGAVEAKGGPPKATQDGLESIYRNVHSLKGLSAIVGLRPAEQLAHGMEDILRGLSKRKMAVTAEAVDALLAATQRFEEIVAAHRSSGESPEIADVLEGLRLIARSPAAADEPEVSSGILKTDLTDQARPRDLRPRFCSFAPSPALDQRGVNVKTVRARLGKIGEIIAATPVVRPDGAIVFEFSLGLREEPSDLAAWESDGIRFQPISGREEGGTAPLEPASAATPAESAPLTPSHIVRVDLSRLDDLMRVAGELVIHRSRLEERMRRYGNDATLKEINLAMTRSLRELHEGISRVRLVPIAEIFASMPLVVRQLGRKSPKQARVALEGEQTPIDKYLVERLKEPLLHLVRNAFAHGVEMPEARLTAGKPAAATILLRAKSMGDSVLIQVRDDGGGIDTGAIAARAAVLGLDVPEPLDAAAVLDILCTPGFSTRTEADLAAGRGVGMDVVANAVRELGGSVALETRLGVGTEFTLRLPLTLSIVEAVIVNVGAEACAVPQGSIDEIVQVAADEIRRIGGAEVVAYRGGLLPLLRLRDTFRLPAAAENPLTLLVVRSERGATGVAVDRVRTQRQVVVRPLIDPLLRVPGISGATELGDGRPVLILDPAALTQGVVRPPHRAPLAEEGSASSLS